MSKAAIVAGPRPGAIRPSSCPATRLDSHTKPRITSSDVPVQIADSEIAEGIAQRKPGWLNRKRVVVYSATFLLCQRLVLAIWAVRWALHEPGVPPTGKRGALPWIAVVAFPGIWVATAHGQNSLITAALATGAFGLLERRPWLAGVCADMLMFKPQLAVLFPLLFLCGRHFRALAAMAITAALFAAVSSLTFGIPLWIKFFEAASWFNATVTENASGGVMRTMPSVFATVRRLGGSVPVAYAVHAAVAIPVMFATLRLWTRRARFEVKAAAAVIATLVIQPYILQYDLAWLLLPIVYLCHDRATRDAWRNRERAIVCLAWCLPLLSLLPSYFPAILQPGVLVLPALFVVTITPPAYHGLFAHRSR